MSDTSNNRVLAWRDGTRFQNGDPADVVIGQPSFNTNIPNLDAAGTGSAVSASALSSPKGLTLDASGNLFVADSGNHRVLRYPRPVSQTGAIVPDLVLGQPDFASASSALVSASTLKSPTGLAMSPDGSLFVADSGNHRVLEFAPGAPSNAAAIRVFGQPDFDTGTPSPHPTAQSLNSPQGLCIDINMWLYVADSSDNRVVVYRAPGDAPAAGAPAAVVIGQPGFDSATGGAGDTGLRTPWDVSVDGWGDILISDSGNNRVVQYPSVLALAETGAVATAVVGQADFYRTFANYNSANLQATPEGLFNPQGILVDRRDTLLVGDTGNGRVVHFLRTASMAHGVSALATAPLAPGGRASLYGSGLASSSESSNNTPVPTSRAGREVVFDGALPAPLFSVSPTEIDLQVPSAAPVGTVRYAVRASETAELLAGGTVVVAATSPGLFVNDGVSRTQGQVLNQDGSPNSPTNSAVRGSVVKIFGTGQGPLATSVTDGQAAPDNAQTVASPTTDGVACLSQARMVCVAVGSVFAEVQFSGLAPQMVGVWQLTVRVPANTNSGNVPVRAVINGYLSNIVTIALR